jgi:16S rRNA processing protein RimM
VAETARPDHLVLGHVVRPHGVHGEVRVAWYAVAWEPFRTVATVWLGTPGEPLQPFRVEHGRPQGRAVVLKLAGIETPEAAAGLVGRAVAIPRQTAPPPPEGTFYHYDILGLTVVAGERSLGSVREILETPAHDVYVVEGPGGEWLLPATRAHIRRVDLVAGLIEIEPWENLVTPSSGGDDSPEAI